MMRAEKHTSPCPRESPDPARCIVKNATLYLSSCLCPAQREDEIKKHVAFMGAV